jgi:hypothetical protein
MYSLRLYHDRYEANAETTSDLYVQHSIYYMRNGSAVINGQNMDADNAIYCQDPTSVRAGADGATIWRWEFDRIGSPSNLADGNGIDSHLKMERPVTMFELYPKQKWLFKLDCIIKHTGSTGLHSHPGSGIRCMLDGEFKIESTIGESFYDLKNDDPWYEEGAYPLVSTAPDGVETTFLRGMILPPEYDQYPDTALWIEGVKPCESGWKLCAQKLITLL